MKKKILRNSKVQLSTGGDVNKTKHKLCFSSISCLSFEMSFIINVFQQFLTEYTIIILRALVIKYSHFLTARDKM
jgi:hypothetical protein